MQCALYKVLKANFIISRLMIPHVVTCFWHDLTAHLDFSNNLLAEGIPDELCDYPKLDTLLLSGNSFWSTIPSCLGESSQIRHLELRDCDLTGPIPEELGQLPDLLILDLSNNFLTSTIPTELGELANLEYLKLGDNLLTGSIPSHLANLRELKALDLTDNDLTGNFPVELERLEELERLSLQGNSGIWGEIPSGMCDNSSLELFSHDIGCNIVCDCCSDTKVAGGSQ